MSDDSVEMIRKEISKLHKQTFFKAVYVIVALLLISSIVLTGCSSEETTQTTGQPTATTTESKYGGTLKVLDAMQGSAFGYPLKMALLYGNKQAGPAIESLIVTDKEGQPVPWLASGWEIADDQKSITFTLRENVKFHDGTDFNAEAAKWNLDQFLDAKYSGTTNIASIDVIDNYTIRMNLTKWDNTILSSMTIIIGLVISPTAFKEHGQEWCETHPVGTGPFEFVSFTPDVNTIYKKFDGYWQEGKPYLDGIEMGAIQDVTTREYSFRNGDADVVLMLGSDQVLKLEEEGYPYNDTPTWVGIVCMVPDSANEDSPWSNLKVRQAAMYAIDVQSMANGIFSGNAIVSNQWTYEGHWSYNPSIVGYPYNPEKAKQTLADAGYPDGFETTLSFVTDPDMDRIFAAVQNYLGEIGIRVTLNPENAPKWAETALGGGTWEGLIYGTASSSPSFTQAFERAYSGTTTWYNSMEVPDDLYQTIEKATGASDINVEQQSIRDAMELLIDKYCLVLPLVQGKGAAISQKYVHDHGFQETPNGFLWTPADAWMEKH